MKTIHHIILLALFGIFGGLLAQGQTAQEQLIGTSWALDYQETLDAVSGSGKDIYDQMDETRRGSLKGFFEGRRFSFSGDGSYTMSHGNGTVQQGTWTLSGANKLELDDSSGVGLSCTVSFSAGQLEMSLTGDHVDKMVFRVWVLKAEQ